jgi:hypothetical protein
MEKSALQASPFRNKVILIFGVPISPLICGQEKGKGEIL